MKICTKAKESVQEFAWWTDLPLPVRVSVVISGQIFMLIFVILGNCITFAMNSVTTAVVLEGLYRKGVIEIIIKTNIYEETIIQFLEGAIPVPGSAPFPAHAGSRG